MRRVLVGACAIAGLGMSLARAQPASDRVPDPNLQPFSGAELLAGKKMTRCRALFGVPASRTPRASGIISRRSETKRTS
jgi:hypothetical protein